MRVDDIFEELSSLSKLLQLPVVVEQPPLIVAEALPSSLESSASASLLKGDNLSALFALYKNNKRFDFIYIDPPYNTGGEFIYNDRRFGSGSPLWGNHSGWMTFMLPRLFLAKNVLESEGVIAISIDDYEYHRLKILMDAIFNENNCIGTLVVCRSKNGKGSNKNIAVNHEYVLIYGKSRSSALNGLEEADNDRYDKLDKFGRYSLDGLFRKKGEDSLRADRPSMFYPLYVSTNGEVFVSRQKENLMEVWPIDSKGVERRWIWGKDKAAAESWRLFSSPRGVVYVKNYQTFNKRVKIRSWLDSQDYLTDKATNELKNFFGEKIFDTPKPLKLIKDLISCCSAEDASVLDFFAGSGTTAHAIADLNKETGSERDIVLVEDITKIPSNHIAASHGFKEISDITEFRLKMLSEIYSDFSFNIFRINEEVGVV